MHLPNERRNQLQLRLPDYEKRHYERESREGKAGKRARVQEGEKREAGTGIFWKKRYLVRERKNAADDLQFR